MPRWEEWLERELAARAEELVAVRRHLHAHPEPSGEEYLTTGYLQRLLSDAGVDSRAGPEGRGLLVEGGPQDGAPVLGLRGDIDALRIHETADRHYRSRTPGVMHACGHDGHAAVLYGAVLALAGAQRSGVLPWPVRWRALFQPAEETSEGALQFISAGALDGMGGILSMHMDPSRPVGTIGLRNGALTAACDSMDVLVVGRGGHAARPHESLDPIAAAAQLISTIYLFIPRLTSSTDAVVVTIGEIRGGYSPNVIPETAELRGTLRTLDEAVRARTREHLTQLARGIAEVSGTRIEVRFKPGPPSVMNDPALTELIREVAADVVGAENVRWIAHPSMGGEDFAHYQQHVPGTMFRLGCASREAGGRPLHSPDFDLDERSLVLGAAILARAAVRWSQPCEGEGGSRRGV